MIKHEKIGHLVPLLKYAYRQKIKTMKIDFSLCKILKYFWVEFMIIFLNMVSKEADFKFFQLQNV